MSRSILTTFFVAFLVAMNTRQALGLAAVLNRVRNNSIWGKRVKFNLNRHANSLLPARVVTAKEASGDQPLMTLPPQTDSFFDADAYRQEMTDLVYQRNMQRMDNN